jgi:GTP-binding protein
MQYYNVTFSGSFTGEATCPKTDLPEFAFIGRSNVGKSSLINLLTNRKGVAKVSGTPGKTKLLNFFLVDDKWFLVDLPGYGYAKLSKGELKSLKKMIYDYLDFRKNLVCTFILIDPNVSPKTGDLAMMKWLGEKQIPFAIVYTKADKSGSKKLQEGITAFRNVVLKQWNHMPPEFTTSAKKKDGGIELMKYMKSIHRTFESINNKDE